MFMPKVQNVFMPKVHNMFMPTIVHNMFTPIEVHSIMYMPARCSVHLVLQSPRGDETVESSLLA